MPDDKPNIPRTNDSHPSGDKLQRERVPDSGNIAPDSDGLVCEHCGERVKRIADLNLISAMGWIKNNLSDAVKSKVCLHCYKIAVDRIKNILGKVV